MISPKNKKIRFLIASGPTQEPLDPVRYLSNNSTGTMGRHLVETARAQGHSVTWLECPDKIKTAIELQKNLRRSLPHHDVLIMAAAVCDVRPKKVSKNKIKKDNLSAISLIKNPDILADLAKIKKKNQIFIGFGLESKDILKNGRDKLDKKRLEVIVLQKVTSQESPFGEKKINATILEKSGETKEFFKATKKEIARFLIQKAKELALGNCA